MDNERMIVGLEPVKRDGYQGGRAWEVYVREGGDDECWIVGIDAASLLPRVTVEDGPQRGHTWLVDTWSGEDALTIALRSLIELRPCGDCGGEGTVDTHGTRPATCLDCDGTGRRAA